MPDCISCLNLQCKLYNDAIKDYTIAVLESIEKAAQKSLPCTSGVRTTSESSKSTPGSRWSKYFSGDKDVSRSSQ